MFKPAGFVDESCENELFRASEHLEETANTFSLISAVIRVGLIILLRAGFLLVQIGNIPVTDVNLILLHNIIELCWTTVCYILIGSTIAFTGNFSGVIGGGYWIGHEQTDRDKALIGWQSAVVASGISTCCLAGRMHTVGTLVAVLIFSGVVHPVIMHWGWSTDGWMLQNRLRENGRGFFDSGGGALVHSAGGLTGLVGCLVLGKRIHGNQLNASPANTFVSYFFILVGLQSLRMTSQSVPDTDPEMFLTIINSLLSISCCTLATVALHFFRHEAFNETAMIRCTQAMLAGEIVISAGASLLAPYAALVLGIVNGLVFYTATKVIGQRIIPEDYCNTVAVHLIPGLLGSLVIPFFPRSDDEFNVLNSLLDFSWQFICLICITGAISLIMTAVFMILKWCRVLRNRSEHLSHLRAAQASDHQPGYAAQREIQSALMPGQVPSRESETVTDSRSVKHKPGLAKLEMPDRGIIDRRIQQNSASTTVIVQPEVKLRKLRSVHTIRRPTDNFENNYLIKPAAVAASSYSPPSSCELRRTFSALDLSSEKNIEHVQMKVLVEPRFKFVSTNSESDDENISDKFYSSSRHCVGDSGDQVL